MIRLLVFLFVMGLGANVAVAQSWIDLSYTFDEQTIYWPSAPGFKIEKTAGFTKDGYYYAANTFCAPEHGGTHLDAPRHFAKGQKTVDQLSVDDLTGTGVLIALEGKVKDDAAYEISEEDIKDFEKTFGDIPEKSLVIFRTGWGRFWTNKKSYLGSDVAGDVTHLKFPGLSLGAARYLASKKIAGVGLDTASLDAGQSRDFKAHRWLLGRGIYGLENLANLEKLNAGRLTVVVAPMKIGGGTGAPARVYVQQN